ncbi:hypothetical protein QF035_009391 [Streptomyces umbrinus]|uniref:Periplasmic binding protein/LacI sugar binding domain-containing protein n=1 Tax=Streptomyces umbrinus TaxID=67370 RepID=A0ABU0TAI7_9ACTN|nr:hypothetical protein [Streptomyces umbrinus]
MASAAETAEPDWVTVAFQACVTLCPADQLHARVQPLTAAMLVFLVVTSVLEPVLHEELRRLGVPLVVIDPAGSPAMDVPTVGATNWAGGMAAAEHLLRLGHRRIGFVAGPPRLLCSRARLDGYRAALDRAGIAVDASLIVPGDFYQESGFTGCNALLGLAEPPTALFAASDQMAMGAVEALRRHGDSGQGRERRQVGHVGVQDDLGVARVPEAGPFVGGTDVRPGPWQSVDDGCGQGSVGVSEADVPAGQLGQAGSHQQIGGLVGVRPEGGGRMTDEPVDRAGVPEALADLGVGAVAQEMRAGHHVPALLGDERDPLGHPRVGDELVRLPCHTAEHGVHGDGDTGDDSGGGPRSSEVESGGAR